MSEHHICPGWMAPTLLVPFRYFSARPKQTLQPYVTPGSTALDIGCGPGFFTLPMAKLVGPEGRVIAADLQQSMLNITRRRAKRRGLLSRITLHQTANDGMNLEATVDFILAAHVVHELPNAGPFFAEAFALLNPGGHCMIIEPKGHVTPAQWKAEQQAAHAAGLVTHQTEARRNSYFTVLRKP